MNSLQYRHVDVFSNKPFSGNGLTVFIAEKEMAASEMQMLTQEMRQFESIFIFPTTRPDTFRARIFTMEEELDFAGHPVLGAACVLHEKLSKDDTAEWQIELNAKTVPVRTNRSGANFQATMEQGRPEFGQIVSGSRRDELLSALNLSKDDLENDLPMEIVSTGLAYLIVPVRRNLENAKIIAPNFEAQLAEVGAKFVYVFQLSRLEGRTWDNFGLVEDIATGSAAGPTGAYLVKHGIFQDETEMVLNQGSFLNRPSKLFVKAVGNAETVESVTVGGDVCMIASGIFDEKAIAVRA
jgi:trans-2,3-dihydro-3-hydroxyanthranilate isomerase